MLLTKSPLTGLFGLLATLVIVGKYGELIEYSGQEVALGASFSLSLVGALLCLVASAFTAWASYKKANFDDDDADCKDITHEMHPASMDD